MFLLRFVFRSWMLTWNQRNKIINVGCGDKSFPNTDNIDFPIIKWWRKNYYGMELANLITNGDDNDEKVKSAKALKILGYDDNDPTFRAFAKNMYLNFFILSQYCYWSDIRLREQRTI